ncbi:HdeD family acid-resistance protein [Allokutzneria albata]|uniref:Uncharacterized membrane protein HdeD, DUF308 family n=1 Tax=Allokutzneria albata TaxID=211114 RepID=A0A1G9WQT9_ALLAB|nr:DUF308 domain-containing protein [Allokutzneria albata]SDM86495.1 Uncharacterized membrane protein HdeD, DUF308 family [Allokutzneria albata]
MGDFLLRRWWLVVVRGVAAILFGIVSLAWPGITVLALVMVFGVYAFVDGVVAVAVALADKVAPSADRWMTGLLGVASLAAGVVAFTLPEITALTLLYLIAAWAVVAGVLQIVVAWRLRKVLSREWLLFVSGGLSVALGLVLFIRPGEGAIALIVTIAAFALLWGVVLTLVGIRLRTIGRRMAAEAELAEGTTAAL